MLDAMPVAAVWDTPRDEMLLRDMSASLVWLPAHGYGYLNVTEQPYDADYFAKYEGYAQTEMGRDITAARVNLIRRHLQNDAVIVDVGIGCGDFLLAVRDAGFTNAMGFDINPAGVKWLAGRGLYYSNPEYPYALTFWDSLEHIPDIDNVLRGVEFVACSLPIVPGDGPPPLDWKHYRPDEHCWYFTHAGFLSWMVRKGFRCVEHSQIETQIGREDIHSYAFRRVAK
jgi:hypothetical protein